MKLTIHNHTPHDLWFWVSATNSYVVQPGILDLQILESVGPATVSWSMTWTNTPTVLGSLMDAAHVSAIATGSNTVHVVAWADDTVPHMFWSGLALPLAFGLVILLVRGFRRIALPGGES